ncbi:Nuclear pore complex nucleoporin component [Dermatophagoides farinae]|uniref:mRNA export factor GLE1 n=1 Tax=Dermatophagoides farinae TaxID=6954 RepID=A0A922I012_DERFA|nr:Nuclear pore complex nucleoporin component [Dermatophagoides farinae]
MSTIVEALKQTKKGQLKYDCNWKEEGRTEEIVNSVKQNLATLNLSPSMKIHSPLSKVSHSLMMPTVKSNLNGINNHEKVIDDTLDNLITDNDNDDLDEKSNDPNFSITDIELKNYEKQKKIEVIQRLEERQREWNEKNESIMKKYEDQMRMIQKKYLLESMRFQKKYDDEIQQLEIELESSTKPQSLSGDDTMGTRKRNLKLREIEEKHKLLLKEKERKQQQQNELKLWLTTSKEKIDQSVRIFDERLKEFPDDDDLNHQRNVAKLLEQDIEVLLLSKNEYTDEDRKFCEDKLGEFLKINEKFSIQFAELKRRQDEIAQKNSTSSSSNLTSEKPISIQSSNNINDSMMQTVMNEQENVVKNKFKTSRDLYIDYQSKLIKFENLCQQFQDNESKKPLRTALQLYVRSIINSICNISIEHLREKVSRLLNLFGQKWFEHKGKKISISDADYSYHFAITTTVKIILLVASKQQNISLKLAPVIVILWANVSMFGDIFLAHLYLSCPYVIPYFPTRTNNQNDTEYTIVLGYQFDKNGQLESEESFQSRMFSLMELYSSIIQCNMPMEEHPRNIHFGWRWLAMILNDQPADQITALLLDAFLSMSAHKMLSTYGRQFLKLFYYIQSDFIQRIETITKKEERQTLMKLKSLLQDMNRKLSRMQQHQQQQSIGFDTIAKNLAPNGLVPNYFFTKSYIFMSKR